MSRGKIVQPARRYTPATRCLRRIGVDVAEGGPYRQILLDGRGLPEDPLPTWIGYSVGRWEGNTMVVESAGFNDRTWLDYSGHPHTDALRVAERYTRARLRPQEIQIRSSSGNGEGEACLARPRRPTPTRQL